MRKDVKLGLAVGGVLLAVLVVYVLVVPGNSNAPVEVVLDDVEGAVAAEETSSDASSKDVASPDDAGAVNPSQSNRTNSSAAESASANADARDAERANSGASADDRATGESAGGGWNWDALVNGTEQLPSLNASADVTADRPASIEGDATAQLTGNDDAASVHDSVNRDIRLATADAVDGDASGEHVAVIAPEAPPQPTTPAAGSARTHVVKPGETYSSIAAAVYGHSRHYAKIEQANPGIDPTKLKPGTVITLPSIDAAPAAVSASARQQPQLDPRTQYKVQPNDSLYTISLRLFGKADRVERIYELNKTAIGDDMSRLKVGMVLKLPEAPSQSTAAATAQ